MLKSDRYKLYLSDFNEQLLSLVQPRPVIYDCRLPNYENGKVKECVEGTLQSTMIQ